MKTLFIIILVLSSCFGEYQSNKIDMHGANDSYLYDNKKSAFGKKSMGIAIFSDNHVTIK